MKNKSTKKNLVSVIVPVYNVQKYLEKCLDSICKQTYQNIEIILVDDGSTDECPKICDKWGMKDTRIKVIHKKNGGLSDARNVGLQYANGKYIYFCDSDDWIENRLIEYCLTYFDEDDVDLVSFKYFIENNEKVEKKSGFPVKYNLTDDPLCYIF